MRVIAVYALRESVRRRVFHVVLVLSVVFLAIHLAATTVAFDIVDEARAIELTEERAIAGTTLLGLAMFATLFLGTVLAIFLTLGAVRGEAERGVLQPLLVRPIGRGRLLAGRFVAAATVCSTYAAVLFLASTVVVGIVGGWWPGSVVLPALALAAAVALIAALALLGSVVLTPTANGIAVFMLYGAGLTAGLMGQIGSALDARTLERVSEIVAWALPYEALYQAGLDALTPETDEIAEFVIELGPFGGAEPASWLLAPWVVLYALAVLRLAKAAFDRRDL